MSKILVVGPAWVGDMVMAQSLFKAIKESNKDAVIDVLAPDWTRPLLDRMPEINLSHSMDIKHGELGLKKRYQLAKRLRYHHYDQAMLLPNSWKSALIPWLANIPKRTGYRGECRWGLLNDIRILDKKNKPRLIEQFAALAYEKNEDSKRPTPYPHLEPNKASIQKILEKFSLNIEKRPILALCPGAEFGPSKRWPESYYAKLANEKIKEGFMIWIFGSKNDLEISKKIENELKGDCFNFTGKTLLGEAIDLLSLTQCVVTNDSGLMHIAAALSVPLVAVYGSTDPSFTPPLNEKSEVVRLSLPCSPCFKRECPLKHQNCMRELLPEKVLTAVDRMIKS